MVGQRLVIESQQMQNRGVKIVNIHRVFGDGGSNVIAGTVGKAGLGSTTDKKRGEHGGVMAAAPSTAASSDNAWLSRRALAATAASGSVS